MSEFVCWFDDVWYEVFLCLGVEVFEFFVVLFLVLVEVEVVVMCDVFEFVEVGCCEGVFVFDVVSIEVFFGVVC